MQTQHRHKRANDTKVVVGADPSPRNPEGGGKMGARVRALDWSRTPLGPLAQWPQSLQTAVSICLASRFPMAICWGPQLALIYNDAYRPILGTKHPAALGQPCYAVWGESRPIIEPMIDSVLRSGEATWSDDLMLPLRRHGYVEEAYFTLSHSAVRDESGGIGGVLVSVMETTSRVLSERRLRLLCDLADGCGPARGAQEACHRACDTLQTSAADIPFALIYLLDDDGDARLASTTGAALPAEAARAIIRADDAGAVWPLARLGQAGQPLVLHNLPARLPLAGNLPPWLGPAWPEPIETAVLLPLAGPGQDRRFGFMVAGVSPRRELDGGYLDFLSLAARQIATAVAHAEAQPEAPSGARALAPGPAAPLEQYRAELYDLFMQAPAPFCVLRGPNLIYELANPAYQRLFGRPDIDLVGKPMLEVLPETRGQGFDELLRRVMRTGIPHVGRETRSTVVRADGAGTSERYWTFVYSPLRNLDGDIDRVVVFAWEVTEQVRARGHLERAQRQAEEASMAKDQFLAMLGHELRNPLSPILTALQLMSLRGLRSREQEVIERQVGHLLRLVDDLMDVARITRGKVELRRDPVEIASIVVRGIDLASPVLEQRKQQLEVNVPPDGMLLNGDCDRLAQVVSNLLTNAAKYSEPGSRIWITATRAESAVDKVQLCIRDEGIGIAPEMLDSIFESFVQQPQALDRAFGGLGLGLAIVRSLVRMHGGQVTAHSPGLGKGSEFRVELPLLGGQDTVAVVDATEDSGRILLPASHDGASSNRVLVVDDNHDGAAVLAETLRELGYLVEIAHDGPSALETARRFKPQIALLDIGLPVMDGYELAGQLRELAELDPGIRLVALTGYGQETDRLRAAKAGFSAHLVKPVNLDVLSNVVRQN